MSEIDAIAESQVFYAGHEDLAAGSRGRGRRARSGLLAEATRTRGFGDFWGHTLVARGAGEAMIEPELNIWDYAAFQVVVEEAGGRVTQLDGSPTRDGGSVVSSNGHPARRAPHAPVRHLDERMTPAPGQTASRFARSFAHG